MNGGRNASMMQSPADMMKARTGRLGVSFKGDLEPAKRRLALWPFRPGVCLLLRWKGPGGASGGWCEPRAQAPVTAPLA